MSGSYHDKIRDIPDRCNHDLKSVAEDALSEARAEVMENLEAYVRLARSDPQAAAVYFHRATGRHIFEVEQPCLL